MTKNNDQSLIVVGQGNPYGPGSMALPLNLWVHSFIPSGNDPYCGFLSTHAPLHRSLSSYAIPA